jgi:hypothetical protein
VSKGARRRNWVGAGSGFLLWCLLWGCGERPPGEGLPTGALRLGSVLGETALEGFARAEAPRSFDFPRDHGPHPEFRSEWWYLTAVLADPSGAEFGVQFTLFRQALAPEDPQPDNRWQMAPAAPIGKRSVSPGDIPSWRVSGLHLFPSGSRTGGSRRWVNSGGSRRRWRMPGWPWISRCPHPSSCRGSRA